MEPERKEFRDLETQVKCSPSKNDQFLPSTQKNPLKKKKKKKLEDFY